MTEETQIPSVLLLTFCRPDHAARVLERIRQAQPAALYVACDGPRPGRADDVENVTRIREMVSRIDWCSSVQTLFRDRNLGCGRAVSEAITWFLEAAGEGIILEDDCLPDETLFRFCAEMLHRYRDVSQVMQVAGYNLLSGRYDAPADYLFSHFGWQWGWATWKRAWERFDLNMRSWPEFKRQGFHRAHPFYPARVQIFDDTWAGRIDTWDYQWAYAMAATGGLSVVPRHSLVENIGFGPGATHGTDAVAGNRYRVPVCPMVLPLSHPDFVCADRVYDDALVEAAGHRSVRVRLQAGVDRLRQYFKRHG